MNTHYGIIDHEDSKKLKDLRERKHESDDIQSVAGRPMEPDSFLPESTTFKLEEALKQ